MCLSSQMTSKEKRDWLKNQPNMITAYKAVKIKFAPAKCSLEEGKKRMFPCYQNTSDVFKRKNKLSWIWKLCSILGKKISYAYVAGSRPYRDAPLKKYTTYYHLFVFQKDAEEYGEFTGLEVIECVVPKKFITTIGMQDTGREDRLSIVARGFEIVGQDEYL